MGQLNELKAINPPSPMLRLPQRLPGQAATGLGVRRLSDHHSEGAIPQPMTRKDVVAALATTPLPDTSLNFITPRPQPPARQRRRMSTLGTHLERGRRQLGNEVLLNTAILIAMIVLTFFLLLYLSTGP